MSRYFLILFLITVFFVSCSDSANNELDKKLIRDLLTQNAKCYKTKNLDCMMGTYLKDSTILAFGTNREFIGHGWDSVKVLFEKDFAPNWEMISYEYENPIIRIENDVAWISSDINSEIKIAMQGSGFNIKLDSRLTAVCKKIDGKWKFVLTNFQHFSNPEQQLNAQVNKLMEDE
jgi:hypothetical protein